MGCAAATRRAKIARGAIFTLALATALGAAIGQAAAQDKYPDWSGRWTDLNVNRWDPAKPPNQGQQAPLTAEYQARLDAAMASRAEGGRGNTPTIDCGHTGMPRAMLVYETLEIVIKPDITYMLFDFLDPLRRIYTDGRSWPAAIDPTWVGYSIGHWEGAGGGQHDTLAIETRAFKGPRIVDGSGIQLHDDNQTVIHERLSLDKDNADRLNDEITLVDHAFTRPWTVTRSYKRQRNPVWAEYDCHENNEHVVVGKEAYFISADGYLMPTRKDQPPPDARYFKQPGGK